MSMEAKSATQMAKAYGLKSSVAFNKLLEKCGVLEKCGGGKYVLSRNLCGMGLVTAINRQFFLPNGVRATRKEAAWTEEGQAYVRRLLAHHGIVPVSEERDLFG